MFAIRAADKCKSLHLTLLGAPQQPRADIAQMEQAALRIMEAIGVQVLVIDEVHNILAGSYREQRIVLNTLRFLSNRLQISLVCFGVNEAREAISGDVQLARRFPAFDAVENGQECITDEAIESWEPDFDTEAAYA